MMRNVVSVQKYSPLHLQGFFSELGIKVSIQLLEHHWVAWDTAFMLEIWFSFQFVEFGGDWSTNKYFDKQSLIKSS